jgi:hypothetical protein
LYCVPNSQKYPTGQGKALPSKQTHPKGQGSGISVAFYLHILPAGHIKHAA